MPVFDLLPELAALVRDARSDAAFKASYWSWLDRHHEAGPLAPLLRDFVHLWSGTRRAPSRAEAEATVARLRPLGYARRAAQVLDRFEEVVGVRPDNDVVLVVGLGAPEGYSRFERGVNTIFIGLDHPANLEHVDHFEVILAHELSHAVRDPCPEVLADYGGWPTMSHDDFVSRYAFREHLVSEALATALSEAAFGGKPAERYVYFEQRELAWCEANRGLIAARMERALAEGEDYRTFYREGVVAPGAPACCDYWFGFHFGRHALRHEHPERLLTTPSSALLARFLPGFLAELLGAADAGGAGGPAAPAPSPSPGPTPGPAGPLQASPGAALEPAGERALDARELALYAPPVRRLTRDLFVRLSNAPHEAAAALDDLRGAVAREGLVYGGQPYEPSPFPLPLARDDLRALRAVSRRLMGAIEKVVDRYLVDPELRRVFDFPPDLEALVREAPGGRRHVAIARFDSLWDGQRPRFLELNTNGTAGFALSERLAALYLEQPLWRDLLRRHGARPFPLLRRLCRTLVRAWREQTGAPRGARPGRIAIVDWTNVPTRAEFHAIAAHLAARGLEAVVCDPGELAYEGGRLVCAAGPIDLVYRRLTTQDLLERSAALEPFLRAARAGAVAVVGGFRADVAHSKKLFAVLTDERWRGLLTPIERAVVDAHVPWTRVLRPERSLWRGRLVDTVELALERREELVLKPATSFEGRGVLLGASTPPDRWAHEVGRHLGGTHILQERVPAPIRTFALPREGRVDAVPLHLHLGEYVLDGRLAGFQAWATPELVISFMSRERAVPVLALADAGPEGGPSELGGQVEAP